MGRTGNSKSVFATMGASNHSETERQKNDYYATEPLAVELLLAKEKFSLATANTYRQGYSFKM